MRARIGLEWRVGALMAALVAALVLAAVGAVWLRMQGLAAPALESAVLRARDLVGEAVAARLDRLDLITRLLANDPPFRAYVAEGHRPSVLDNLQDRLSLYACDAFVLVDGSGRPLFDTRRAGGDRARDDDARAASSLLAAALAGEPSRGLWVEPEGGLYLAAMSPLAAGEAAAIVALEGVDGGLALALRRATGAELLFYAGGSAAPVPGATTLSSSRSQLERMMADAGPVPGAGPRRHDLDGEEFVAIATPLTGDGADRPAGFMALRSVDRELASFRKIQAVLLIVGVAALPVALTLGFLFARRITRPIAALVRATGKVRAGDYDLSLPPETGDEIGALAGAFRIMVSQLKEKEELDAWIGALAARVAGSAEGANEATRSSETRTLQPAPSGGGTIGPGRLLHDRFRILQLLGAGGMGTVFKARDERLQEFVAIKILPPRAISARADRVEHVRQEIRLARRVTHRNVLRTHELLEVDGAWAILMEYVDGVPLDRLLAAGRLPLAAGLRIIRQICAGLEAAHAQGVVHGDLKPSNVMVDSAGGVKIADFGLARASDAAGGGAGEGAVAGTPQYMSPEEASGRPGDLRSDIYSAGVMYYEILCGRRPFQKDSAEAVLRAHAEEQPPAPRSINRSIGPSLDAVLMRSLAKDPAERYPSARELAEAIAGVIATGAAA